MQKESAITAEARAGIVKRLAQIAVLFVILMTVLLLSSGLLLWPWAWMYLGIYVTATLFNTLLLIRRSPETIAERSKTDIEQGWEKIIGGLWALAYFIAVPLVAGLSVRFQWNDCPSLLIQLLGMIGFAGGLALVSWAMVENAYFVTTARIQADRKQRVCNTGPYRWVRHPGYLGAIIQGLATPLLLGSAWALIPGSFAAVMMITRTVLEDDMLQRDLIGYEDYAKQIRHRLMPGIW